MNKIVLNKNKSIGKVVFVVEGDKKEHTLLGHIFEKILDYSVVDVKRNRTPYSKYVSKINPDSRIFVISGETSNIRSAGREGKGYLDRVFSGLYTDYSLDISNAAVYYIFDRDNESNFYSEAEKLTHTLVNSRDNGFEANGLLLLSYPCIEAYIKSCFDDYKCETINTPKELKTAVNDSKYQYHKMDCEAIMRSCCNMLLGIESLCGRKVTESDLDDFSEIGSKVLDAENQLYMNKKQYMLLSLISIAFMDLEILRVSE
jgi:hypothetical protein